MKTAGVCLLLVGCAAKAPSSLLHSVDLKIDHYCAADSCLRPAPANKKVSTGDPEYHFEVSATSGRSINQLRW
jgi:hypothetical protein